MAKSKASALLDGDEDPAENTPKAPPQSDDVWDRAGEDAKREKRGEPPLTDDEWNEMRANEDGEIPEDAPFESPEEEEPEPEPEPEDDAEAKRLEAAEKRAKERAAAKAAADRAEKPATPRKGTTADVKAKADRAEKAADAKRGGSGKLPGAAGKEALAEATAATKKRRGRKEAEPEPEPKGRTAGSNTIAGEQLLSIVERYENLEEEAATIKTDMKELLAEAKGNGYDTKVIRRIIKTRKMDKDKMDEEDSLFDLYMQAIEDAQGQD